MSRNDIDGMLQSVFLACLLGLNLALTPLTEIPPESKELSVFGKTLQEALTKSGTEGGAVVHIVGATSVEDAVDWAPLCKQGHSLVLVGPQVSPISVMVKGEAVVPRDKPGQECVTVVRGLYSRGVLREALGADHKAVEPDLAISYNADVYMDYWRRTLAELIQLNKPVVVTMYCEYEGNEVLRLFNEAEKSFSDEALEVCDSYIRKRYRGDADQFMDVTPVQRPLPSPRILWSFTANSHAHMPPQDCLAKPYRHGVRNSYWLAFVGTQTRIDL